MKSMGSLFTVVFFIVLGQMCNDNEQEQDEPANPVAVQPVKKLTGEDAGTDWKQFASASNQMILLSENNLKTLKFKIKNAQNPNDKIKWKMVYNTSEYKIRHLRQRWEGRKDEIMFQVRKANNKPLAADSVFTAAFIRQMAQVNRELEKVIDE